MEGQVIEYLPDSVREGIEQARRKAERRKSRLRLEVDGRTIRVLRSWSTGFAVAVEEGDHLRGLVDLYDGARHVSQCLIMTSRDEGGERIYEFKRATAVHDQPPVDFERLAPEAPGGLLPSPD
ncbi:hypothetical protein OG2516_09093 [Oceanicola granulosus HTCC2516]|uniref:Uncharacterized protein n=1 Tax=Oceanicola granulosus (strain ATCC BAA-861 / DSM 15982 / KCTC 12143 / HTCC2516) TaxID=314256 RepID=Q2CCN1_OCEGH|nr:hypothetical protein OG2516_09093 [Oceanicola granulosus HTCC2516]